MDLSEYHPGLGVFAGLTFLTMLCGLAQVFGRPLLANVDRFIVRKKLSFVNKYNYAHYLRFFRIVYYGLLALPSITICVWSGVIFYIRRHERTYVGPISVLLIGLAVAVVFIAHELVVLRRYLHEWSSTWLFVLGAGLLMAYQLLGNFYYSLTYTFFGLSALFLTYNCVLVIFIIYVNIGKNFIVFGDILTKQLKPHAEGFEPHPPHKDLAKCLEEDSQNDKYALTIPEYNTFFTLTPECNGLETRGIISSFVRLSPWGQLAFNAVLYVLSLGLLVAYSCTVYYEISDGEFNKLGVVTSVATVTTDAILCTLYHAGIATTVGGVSVFAVVFRGCLFGFDGKYWYYGYCVLYCIIGIRLSWEQACRQFPVAASHSKSSNEAGSCWTSILKAPIAIWALTSAFFGLLTWILECVRPNGVPLTSLGLAGYDFDFWLFAVFSLIFTVLCYALFALVRIVVRRTVSYVASRYFVFEILAEFWVYAIVGYAVTVCGCVVLHAIIDRIILVVYAAFLPGILILLVFAGTHYAMNNFSVLQQPRKSADKSAPASQEEVKVQIVVSPKSQPECESPSALKSPRSPNKSSGRDWRRTHSTVGALFKGLLAATDYCIVVSVGVSVLLTFFLGLTLQLLSGTHCPESWIGVTTGVAMLSCIVVVGSLVNSMSNGVPLSWGEGAALSAGLTLYIAYGIGFFQGRERGDIDIHYNIYSLPVYAAILPGTVSALMGVSAAYMQRSLGKLCLALWSVTVASLGVLIGFVWLVWGHAYGLFMLMIVCSIVLAIVLLLVSNRISFYARVAFMATDLAAACTVMIVNFAIHSIDLFTGFSISYLLVTAGVFLLSLQSVVKAVCNFGTHPVLLSSYVFPAYQYNATQAYPVKFGLPLYCLYGSLVAFLFWTVLLSIYVEPVHYGISVGLFTIVFAVALTFVLSSFSSYKFKEWEAHITPKVINEAWLAAKSEYIKRQGVMTLCELQTFRGTKESNDRVTSQLSTTRKKREVVRDNVRENVEYAELDYVCRLQWQHKARERLDAMFRMETRFKIHFEMLVLMAAHNASIKDRQEFVNFVRLCREELRSRGIEIDVEDITNPAARYEHAASQKAALLPEQQREFNMVWQEYKEKKLRDQLLQREFERKINNLPAAPQQDSLRASSPGSIGTARMIPRLAIIRLR